MIYLAIIVVIAAFGLGRLWLIQRRHATSIQTVDGFRSSLERLSGQQAVSRVPGPAATPEPSGRAWDPQAPSQRSASDPYLEPLDPARRAAAKRRLEARRRGALRSSDLRSR